MLCTPQRLITYVTVEGRLEGSVKEEVLVRLGRFDAQLNRFEQCWKEMQPGIEVIRWWDTHLEL